MIKRREPPPVAETSELKGFDDFDIRLGDVMRGERATLGKSLLDIQRELKIKAAYIAAIENADPSAFETQGFVAGYVRSYARYLGLDPEWAFTRFCRESNFETLDGMASGASVKQNPKPAKRVRNVDPLADPDAIFLPKTPSAFGKIEPSAFGSSLVLLMLISAIGYGGWSVFREIQKVQFVPIEQTAAISPDLTDVLSPANGAADDATFAEAPSAEAFDRMFRPEALDVPVFEARDAAIATLDPREMGALAPGVNGANTSAQDNVFATDLEAEAIADELLGLSDPDVVVAEAAPPAISIFAVRPSWVRVRAADGTLLFEKILDAGEVFEPPLSVEPAILRAGNSGSIYFTVNGETFGPAGDGPSVVDGVQLGATEIAGRFVQADPLADADLARFVALANDQ